MAATSLRIQFVLPMLVAILATAFGVTVCSKWFADRASRRATLEQLSSTGKLCVNAKYPLTESVLTQIQELSSLRLAIVYRANGARDESIEEFRLESKSSAFPELSGQGWIEQLVAKAFKPDVDLFFTPVELGDGSLANATAYLLPKNQQSNSNRFLVLLQSQSEANATSVQAFVLPLVTGIFSSIAIAMAAAWVASGISQRIEKLSAHVKKIAEGSFETIAPDGPIDAIHTLYESVNSMSLQLQQSTLQIAQNERSRLINLMASGLAHELRNHLTGARLAIQTCSPDPSTQEAISISLKQMKLAEESIQRLLTLRVDTADKKTPPMLLQQVHESVRDLVMPIANHQRVAFEIGKSFSNPDGTNDPNVMHQWIDDGSSIVGALINLVLNAIEAAGPGGSVSITATRSENSMTTMEWVVRDNGPGPTIAMAAAMFEPFATTKREGVGLGLAMCKRIAQRHGGDVDWRREDGCTVFTLRIQCTMVGEVDRGEKDNVNAKTGVDYR